MKPGDRVIVLRGEHEGRTGTITDAADNIAALRSAILPGPTRNKIEQQLEVPKGCHAVRIDAPAAVLTVSIEEGDLVVTVPRRIPLLVYLDRLEATAKAAPGGRWRNPNIENRIHYGEVVSDEAPFDEGYAGQLVAESLSGRAMALLIATQPSATLALIAKLRSALMLLDMVVSSARAGTDLSDSWADELDLLATIEVP